jgi:hypothetical protein
MPRLSLTYKEAAVKTQFKPYYYGLNIHDDGHGRVWPMAHGEMDRDLSMVYAGSCDELRNILAERYKAIIAK